MHTTSLTLLERLREPGAEAAWARFVKLYTPLLYSWAHRAGLRDQDAADLVQDVFTALVQKLPVFDYDPHKSFRSWLRAVILNLWRDRQRRQSSRPAETNQVVLGEVAESDKDSVFAAAEYRRQLFGRALELLEPEYAPSTWKAFREHGLKGRAAGEVAAELGISVGAVYAGKFRVLGRLREELRGFIEESDL